MLAQVADVRTAARARYKVVEVIRGETPAGALIEPSWIVGLDHAATASAKPLLLIRGQKWQSWANVHYRRFEGAHMAASAFGKQADDRDDRRRMGNRR